MTWPLVPVDGKTLDWPRKIAQAINWLIGNKQPLNGTLTDLSARNVGAASGTDIPDRDDADARYVMQDVGAAWAAPTGTAARTTFATFAGQTISNPPTQAEVQAIDDHVKLLSERVKALVDDLQANGTLT